MLRRHSLAGNAGKSYKPSAMAAAVIAASALFMFSCATTRSAEPENASSQEEEETRTERTTGGRRELKVINSAADAQETKAATPESIYKEKISGITLSVESAPKETTAGRAFAAPFVFKAKKLDGSPVEGLELAVSYPETKSGTAVSFALASLTTTSSGTVVFIPATPQSSFDSEIRVYPAGDVTNPAIAEAAESVSVSAPYKVKTNKSQAGGTISVVDFSQSGKPIVSNSVSSSNILMALMKLGFKRVGNADFTTSILSGDRETVYKAAKALIGSASSYLIYGTVKYASPLEQDSDGKYTLTLEGSITCLDMRDGSVLLEATRTAASREDKDWNCLPSARKSLADALAEDINYGL